MSKITLPLYADFVNRKLVTKDGSSYTLPTFTLGDTWLCPLHLMEHSTGAAGSNDLVEGDYAVRSVRASVGKTMDPPASGGWNLQLEQPDHLGTFWTGDSLALAIATGDLLTALQTLFTNVAVTVADLTLAAPACWIFSTDGTQAYNLMGGTLNTLLPVSFVRVRPFQQATKWWYEIRLIVAPLAFNEDGFDRVLPDPPSITRIQAGTAATDTAPAVDELQDLFVPPDFRGTYYFQFDFHRSVNVGYQDGQDVAAAALNAMFGDSTQRFNVTTPEDNHGQIEFVGPLGGAPQDLISVEVYDHPPGVINFTIPLDRAEMASALRTGPSITVTLEIQIEVVDNPADLDNLDVAGRVITLCQQDITVVREGIWKEMATVQKVDYQRPTSPRTYLPYNESQLIPGQQHYPAVIGDGESTEITVDHNLGTKLLAGPPLVAQNVDGGEILTQNEDYTVTIESENSVKFAFANPPALNSLVVVITTAGPVSTFIADLHIAMGQVDGLDAALAALGARIAGLEELLPSGGLVLPNSTATTPQDFPVPDTYFIYPNARLDKSFVASSLSGGDAKLIAALPRPPALLPAIHNATVTDVTALPDSPSAGSVFRYTGTDPLDLPAGGGRRSSTIITGDFFGFDGRYLYSLTHAGDTKSYFPRDFELPLWPLLDINDGQWNAGQRLTFGFDLDARVFRANTSLQYLLVVEWGVARSQTDPEATATNLSIIDWFDVPLLTQRLVLSALPQKKHFGGQIKRGADGKMTALKLLANTYSAADSCPLTPSFLVRGRLIEADTENKVAAPIGYAWVALTNVDFSIQ
ncbi:MAG: hypothetical protein P4L99_28145 [Chthoniobacter sp.]|nr:hypothetical protein [Chthoniobacter sp.]